MIAPHGPIEEPYADGRVLRVTSQVKIERLFACFKITAALLTVGIPAENVLWHASFRLRSHPDELFYEMGYNQIVHLESCCWHYRSSV